MLAPLRFAGPCSLVVLSLCFTACGGDGFESGVADVEGTYSVALTAETNGCEFENWTEGQTAENVSVIMSQEGGDVSATVEGVAGLLLALALGTDQFHGTVVDSQIMLDAQGVLPHDRDGCVLTWNGSIDAEVTGNTLEGKLTYTPAPNSKPECAYLMGCSSVQHIAGARPPKP